MGMKARAGAGGDDVWTAHRRGPRRVLRALQLGGRHDGLASHRVRRQQGVSDGASRQAITGLRFGLWV